MKIEIGGQQYQLTDESIMSILSSIETFATDQYQKMPETAKLAAMAAVRALLAYAERAEKDPEKKALIRPPKKTDPTLHLIRLLIKFIGEILPHVQCEIATDEQRITNFSFQYAGQSRGQIHTDGVQRIGENDSSQVT